MLTLSRDVDRANILVVDDYSDAAETMALWLELTATMSKSPVTVTRPIEIARRQRPNYVLLDLGLPGLDGYQVASTLRHELAGPLVIIAITGYGREEDRRRVLAAGFDHYFLKPIDHEHPDHVAFRVDHRDRIPPVSCRAAARGDRPRGTSHAHGQPTGRDHQYPRPPSPGRRQIRATGPSVPSRSPDRLRWPQGERPEYPRPGDARRRCGRRLELETDGPDAEAAMAALASLIEHGFDETSTRAGFGPHDQTA